MLYNYESRVRRVLTNIFFTLIGSIAGGLIILAFINNGLINLPKSSGVISTAAPVSVSSQLSSAANGAAPVVDIAEKVGPAVVGIVNKGKRSPAYPFGSTGGGTGSGVVFDANGYIVTNNHVVAGASELEVVLSNGQRLPAKMVGTDDRTDLAVIKVESTKLTAATFGDSDKVRVGELAVAIGNPLGEDYYGSVTSGIISATRRTVSVDDKEYVDLLQTDAAINPGNSGGALINAKGEVIGINSVKIGGNKVEGMGFAIPSNSVQRVISDLVKSGRVQRPWLGVIYQGDISQLPDAPKGVQYGVMVKVAESGPAQKSGMKDGDVITAVNGEKIENFAALQRIILKSKTGDKLEVELFRAGKQQKLSVVLEERPAD